MKNLYIIIGIIVLVGFGFMLFGGDTIENVDVINEDTESQMTTETDAAENTEVEMETESVSDVEADVTQHKFTLDSFNYGYSETELRVKEGDTVTINLTNSEGFHDWVVDEFDAATEKIREGGTASVTFVADAAGTYEYYCSVGSHRANGMVGSLIVE